MNQQQLKVREKGMNVRNYIMIEYLCMQKDLWRSTIVSVGIYFEYVTKLTQLSDLNTKIKGYWCPFFIPKYSGGTKTKIENNYTSALINQQNDFTFIIKVLYINDFTFII